MRNDPRQHSTLLLCWSRSSQTNTLKTKCSLSCLPLLFVFPRLAGTVLRITRNVGACLWVCVRVCYECVCVNICLTCVTIQDSTQRFYFASRVLRPKHKMSPDLFAPSVCFPEAGWNRSTNHSKRGCVFVGVRACVL